MPLQPHLLRKVDATFKIQGKCRVGPLPIDIENKKGSVRKGVGANGRAWEVTMPFDYGYIRGTEGADGDEVDCFVGPDRDSNLVFVIHQSKENSKDYDEDKVMLGFLSQAGAKKAYHDAFNGPDLLDSVTKLTMKQFVKSLVKYRGKKIAAEQEHVMPIAYDTVPKRSNLTKQQRQLKINVEEGAKNAIRQGDPKQPVTTAMPTTSSQI